MNNDTVSSTAYVLLDLCEKDEVLSGANDPRGKVCHERTRSDSTNWLLRMCSLSLG